MDLVKDLNALLADLAVFYRKLQNYHWNIEGLDFFVVHAKLEEYYDEVNAQIDEVGEHILVLGGQPLGTMKDYLDISVIVEAEDKKIKSEAVFHNVINDYSVLFKKAIQLKEKADEQKEYATSAMMDTLIADYSKKIWMLKQSMN